MLMKEESARTRYRQASGTLALPVLPYGAVLAAVEGKKRREPLISADCTFAQIQFEKRKRQDSCGRCRNLRRRF